jgi:hypothetical protein
MIFSTRQIYAHLKQIPNSQNCKQQIKKFQANSIRLEKEENCDNHLNRLVCFTILPPEKNGSQTTSNPVVPALPIVEVVPTPARAFPFCSPACVEPAGFR